MQAEIIAVGTEILLGQIMNTNSTHIAQGLAEVGIDSYYQTVVGDNPERLAAVIEIAAQRNDLVILAGGLGPTNDDLTKQTLAKYLNVPLVEDAKTMQVITDHFEQVGREMTPNNRLQALYPAGATPLMNHNGLAVGAFYQSPDSADFILLPGPPREMALMFDTEVKPQLQQAYGQQSQIYSRVLRFFGITESKLATVLNDLIEHQSDVTVAPYAKTNEVTLRLSAQAASKTAAKAAIDQMEAEINGRVGEFCYGRGDHNSLAKVVINDMIAKHLSITAAESLTAGQFQSTIGGVPGVSAIFPGGFVTYANAAKHQLVNVPQKVIDEQGVVSEATAIAMAHGARAQLATDTAVSFTGVAGPDELEGQPAGTVWIGIAYRNQPTVAYEYHFTGDRQKIRERSVLVGLDLLRRAIAADTDFKK
ncbi:competence/damage-inducible protein A [Lactiplantibacillus fabifermentans]|uniref:Putative competence-damage inducible protein n=2 Tax=Lactiplantibacillus fabifermentans TaxID=483011 RepID=A0A0R2NS05_9LACO|nr:competence/damage-inducible protein A [Lactiplantibacillus fabifermentans]ETY73854.1 damage-inducible protein A [Lactiplantibacillus fabifermentans T30PCM01]KRO28188.1 competence-damage inducible protein [Lactiplantibacillus fabifermentans DSM 21115]